MQKVYIKFNTAVIKEVVLDKDVISFGRRADNDIVIDHPTISGHHGRLKKDGDHYVVEDLNSTNGTFINGRRIKSGSIKDKDQVGVAGHILDYHDGVEEQPVAPAAPATPAVAPVSEVAPSQPAKPVAAAEPVPIIIMEDVQAAPSGEAPAAPKGPEQATIRIISGNVDGQIEVTLKEMVTYVGTKQQAAIKIKGFLAPDLAAAISKRPDGYFLKAIKAGYPKVNGLAIQEQILLENGAMIEIGGTNMVFVKTR